MERIFPFPLLLGYVLLTEDDFVYNEIAQQRYALLHDLEKKRGTKIITLVGISPFSKLDNIAAEKVVANIKKVKSKNIELFINTDGGSIEAGWIIARTILHRNMNTNVIVVNKAKSAGTLISLAADTIIATDEAEFGPVDPKIPVEKEGRTFYLPAVELLKSSNAWERKQAESVIKVVREYIHIILKRKLNLNSSYNEIERVFLRVDEGEITHSFPIFPCYLAELGFQIDTSDPNIADFRRIYELYLNDPERPKLEKGTHIVEMSSI
ncbi:MAG: SDH family Clp fold serine proteinase [Candidatus Baldrarchaeia archaeon]